MAKETHIITRDTIVDSIRESLRQDNGVELFEESYFALFVNGPRHETDPNESHGKCVWFTKRFLPIAHAKDLFVVWSICNPNSHLEPEEYSDDQMIFMFRERQV